MNNEQYQQKTGALKAQHNLAQWQRLGKRNMRQFHPIKDVIWVEGGFSLFIIHYSLLII
jgi:hypothetical protein